MPHAQIDIMIYLAVGLVLVVLGIIVWVKQKLSLIYSFMYAKVAEKDIPAYTAQIAKAYIVMGAGLCLTGVINVLTQSHFGLISLGIGLVCSLIIIATTQKKYNTDSN